PLLTREGEVELAKRIEEGTNAVRDALFASSVIIDELTRTSEQLQENRIRARELLNVEADDDTFDEEAAANHLVEQIDKIKRVAKRRGQMPNGRPADPRQAKAHAEVGKLLLELNLNKRTIDRMAQKLKAKALIEPEPDGDVSQED